MSPSSIPIFVGNSAPLQIGIEGTPKTFYGQLSIRTQMKQLRQYASDGRFV